MPFFERFQKLWGTGGVKAEPTANQADTGFSFLGESAPSVELFNALLFMLDQKDKWLYDRLAEVMVSGGVTPSEATKDQLLIALRALFAPGQRMVVESGPFIVPGGVTKIRARGWGGGGGGGGSYGPNSAGSGGGGGGYFEGVFNVIPGASIYCTVGKNGLGSRSLEIYSATAGGATSFGSFATAFGGSPGAGGLNAFAVSTIFGGSAQGGSLNISGSGGGFGQQYPAGTGATSYPNGGGIGGSSPFGGAPSSLSIGGNGNGGAFPGGGGTGAGMSASAGGADSYTGGPGGAGLLILDW